ncbi:MAG: DNA polymerase III subunit delta [Marinilabiliaceae bacterium]
MKFEDIVSQLEEGQFAQVYVLMGEEPWYADHITDYIALHALKAEEKDFNQTTLYGNDINAVDIVHAARRYPMMAPRQLVIVREAQLIKDISPLSTYLEAPAPTTILVLNFRGKIDKRSKLWNTLKKKDFVVTLESEKLKEYQVGPWITNHLKKLGFSIDSKASTMLVEHLGNNLSNVVKALDKLKVAVGKDVSTITPEHVEEYVGISKDYNTYELQKAITQGNVLKANQIARVFGQNPKSYPIPLVTGTLFSFFRKLMFFHVLMRSGQNNENVVAKKLGVPPFAVKEYKAASRRYNWGKCRQSVSVIREIDMRSKGYNSENTPPEDLLKELIFKLMH